METEYRELPVTIKAADGISVPAIFTDVESPQTAPLLLLHGLTTHKNEYADFFVSIARAVASIGTPSLRIDFRGHGESRESSRAFTIVSQVLDARAAAEWAMQRCSAKAIHVLGCSFGGPVALLLAKLMPALVSTISLVCPVLSYRRTFLEPETDWGQEVFSDQAMRRAYETGVLSVTPEFNIDVKLLLEMSLLDSLLVPESTSPILLIHGQDDSMVPYNVSVEAARSTSSINFVGIAGMDHGFMDADDEMGTSPRSQQNLERIVREIEFHIGRIKE